LEFLLVEEGVVFVVGAEVIFKRDEWRGGVEVDEAGVMEAWV